MTDEREEAYQRALNEIWDALLNNQEESSDDKITRVMGVLLGLNTELNELQ